MTETPAPTLETADAADCTRLADAVAAILPALERFNRFEGPDRAARDRNTWLALLERPLPATGLGLDGTMDELARIIPYGLRNGHPGFSGYITTAPTTSGVAACLAATVAGCQRWCVQPFNFLETLALRWLREMFGLDADMQGTFNSGGSTANIIGLGAARQGTYERLGFDVAADGLPPDRPGRIYASREVHHVNNRAAAVLGLGRRAVVAIPVDDTHRIRVDLLRETLERDRDAGIVPVAIVGTAGTVNTGAIDPLADLADLAAEFGSWLHVDGCYGMFGMLDERVAGLYRGVERADSVAADPHKWLAAPVGCGATFVRDRGLLGRTYTLEPAAYLEGSVGVERIESPYDDFGDLYHDFNLEQSAPSRGAHVWAILREMGRDGVRDRIVRHNDFARRLADLADADPRLEVLARPVLSICCFRYAVPEGDDTQLNAINTEIARRLRAEGVVVPSTTVIDGRLAIRPCSINPRTRECDVDLLARRVAEIGDAVTA